MSDPNNSCAERPANLILHTGVVIAGLTRNPVVVWHWIPDVETPDLIRGRDDHLASELSNDLPVLGKNLQ